MTDANLASLKKFGRALLIFVLALVAIISNAAVWNTACGATIGGFEVGVSIVNFIAEGTLIALAVKKYLING